MGPACVFHQCLLEPTTIVVWGCFEHIDEFVVCPEHLQEWIAYHNNRSIRCTVCYDFSEEFMCTGIQLMHPTAVITPRKMH